MALSSLWNRRGSALLTLASLTISMAIVIGVEHLRAQAESSFVRTISGTDLLVGARTSQINLLLYSVFRIGNPTNGINWSSYQEVTAREGIAWSIPLALGDSHRGYRVLGTSREYFTHFRYGDRESLRFTEGGPFSHPLHAVLGSEVASALGYSVGEEIVLSHGVGNTSFVNHEELPFNVTGVLAGTGTPVDRTIHVTLQGIEAIHLGWQNGVQVMSPNLEPDDPRLAELQPDQVTAFLLGLDSPMASFNLQRAINNYPREPLTAVMPTVALAELWQIVGTLENLLRVISLLVLVASLLGLCTMLLTSLRERKRELALYRAIGARPLFIVGVIELEAVTMTVISAGLAYLAVAAGFLVMQNWLSTNYALLVSVWPSTPGIWLFMAGAVLASALLTLLPATIAYRRSLGDSLKVG